MRATGSPVITLVIFVAVAAVIGVILWHWSHRETFTPTETGAERATISADLNSLKRASAEFAREERKLPKSLLDA